MCLFVFVFVSHSVTHSDIDKYNTFNNIFVYNIYKYDRYCQSRYFILKVAFILKKIADLPEQNRPDAQMIAARPDPAVELRIAWLLV